MRRKRLRRRGSRKMWNRGLIVRRKNFATRGGIRA